MKMFKLVSIMCALVCAIAMATPKFPGDTASVEKLNAYIEAAKDDASQAQTVKIARACVAAKGLTNPTFAAIEDVYKQNGVGGIKVYSYCLFNQVARADAYASCKQSGSVYAIYYISNKAFRNEIKMSDDEALVAYKEIVDKRDVGTMGANQVSVIVNGLASLKVKDEAAMKEFLKELNRTLSMKLLGQNKDQWENIVAKIRTLLATY